MITKSKINTFLGYVFLFMIIALTGFEYFFRDNNIIYFFLFPLSTFVFFWRKNKFQSWALALILLITITLSIQCYKFGISYSFVLTASIRFLTYYFIATIVFPHFNKLFVNIAYWLAGISLFFYFGTLISPSFYNFLVNISANIKPLSINDLYLDTTTNPNHTLIFYTIPLETKLRNNGPFWEPGMFAVIINIALAIRVIEKEKLFDKKIITLLITSITTFSTASLIATFIILIYYNIIIRRNIYSLIFLALLAFVLAPVYQSQFFKGKIDANMETIDKSYSRFGAVLHHWEQIKEDPITGMGLNAQQMENNSKIADISPNGLTNIVRVFGIPLSLIFYFLLYKFSSSNLKFNGFNTQHAILLFFVFLIVAFSQDITTRHLFFVFIFLSFAYQANIQTNKR